MAQAVGKALRFGLDDGYPGTDRKNADDIAKELNQISAVAEMLREVGAIPMRDMAHDIEVKRAHVEHYMNYAEQRGTLTLTPCWEARPQEEKMSTADEPRPVGEIVGREDADWKGKHKKRFIWSQLRFEWGRMCYRTNCFGETLEAWWESDTPNAS